MNSYFLLKSTPTVEKLLSMQEAVFLMNQLIRDDLPEFGYPTNTTIY